MPSRSERLLPPLAGLILLFTLASPALAAETSDSEFVIVREGEVFPEDLYAGAIRIVIDGTLDGDLVAFAAEEIVINGTVNGSVTALTPVLSIAGEVGGSVRASGSRVNVSGEVGGDLVAAVGRADLTATSVTGGDVVLWAWNADVFGSIGTDLTGTQRSLDLAGVVEGDVDVNVGRLTVVGELRVDGDLGYRSRRQATGLELADVGGTIVEKRVLPPNIRVRALGLLVRILVLVVLSVAALSAAYGWPQRTSRAIAAVGTRPLRRWLRGAAVMFSPLLVMAVTGLILGLAPAAVAFPLLAVLVPVILALLGITAALAIVAGAPVAGWLGGVIFKRLDLYGAMLAGSLLIGVLWWVPLAGWLVPLLVLPWGLGAWMATRSPQSSSEESDPVDLAASA